MNYSVRAALDFAGANTYNSYRYRSIAGVAELADARDLKSLDSDVVPVQARSPAPRQNASRFDGLAFWFIMVGPLRADGGKHETGF